MDFFRRLDRVARTLFLWIACWGAPIALALMMTSPSYAAIRTIGSGLNSVSITGQLDGLGGGGGSAPVLTAPNNVRMTSRTLATDVLDRVSHLEDDIEERIEASFDTPSGSATVVVPATCIQPTATVEADASTVFGCDAYQQKTTSTTIKRLGTTSGTFLLR